MLLGRLLPIAALAAALLTACGGADDDPVRLEVTVQDWSGWSREQPEPTTFTRELSPGDDVTVGVLGNDELVVTVVQVDDGEVALELSDPMWPDEDTSETRTTFSLDRHGSVKFTTPTLDAGTSVTVAER